MLQSVPYYSLFDLWLFKSLLPLYSTNNTISLLFSFLGNTISSYPFCIFFPSHPLVLIPSPEKMNKNYFIQDAERSDWDHNNFKSWHIFRHVLVPLLFYLMTTITSQKQRQSWGYRHRYQTGIPQLSVDKFSNHHLANGGNFLVCTYIQQWCPLKGF